MKKSSKLYRSVTAARLLTLFIILLILSFIFYHSESKTQSFDSNKSQSLREPVTVLVASPDDYFSSSPSRANGIAADQSISKNSTEANLASNWTQKGASGWYAGRYGHAMAYTGGDKAILFGGHSGGYLQDTWRYDYSSDGWNSAGAGTKPSFRRFHAMAYIGGNNVLLFGGETAYATFDNETWLYNLDQDRWTKLLPASSPSARFGHAMAYIGDDKVLLHGGDYGRGNYSDETWIFDLSDKIWKQKFPSSTPGAKGNHAMAYIGNQRVIEFAYQTWIYDLNTNTWTQKVTSNTPMQRLGHAMAYLGGEKAVLFGGYSSSPLGDTWIYDLRYNLWTEDLGAIKPKSRWHHSFCETSLDGSSPPIMFGGAYNWLESELSSETWEYDPSNQPIINDVWWTNEIDNDHDGYKQEAKLNIAITFNQSAGSKRLITNIGRKKSTETNYSTLWVIDQTSVTMPGVYSVNTLVRGQSQAQYDFKIGIYDVPGNLLLEITQDMDQDVNNYAMEPSGEDIPLGNVTLTVLNNYNSSIPMAWKTTGMVNRITEQNSTQNPKEISSTDNILYDLSDPIKHIDEKSLLFASSAAYLYNIYRAGAQSGPFSLIKGNHDRQYYRDNQVTNGQTYYYKVAAVQNNSEVAVSSVVSGSAQSNGYYAQSGWAGTAPTLNGIIDTAEWSGAVTKNITYPGRSGPVTLYAMNNSTHLFLAIDDKSDAVRENGDQMMIYFDGDHNREWPSSSGNEGNYWIYWDTPSSSAGNAYRSDWGYWPDHLNLGDVIYSIAGVNQGISANSGHVQYETRISFADGKLGAAAGDMFGILLGVVNKGMGTNYFTSVWPQESEKLTEIESNIQWWGKYPFAFASIRLASSATTPALTVNPLVLDFGTTATQLTFTIQNSGAGTLTWSVAENPAIPWITSITPSSGTNNITVTVKADRNLLPGILGTGQLTVTSNGGTQNITVRISQLAFSLPPTWTFSDNTGNSANILIPVTANPSVNGQPILSGDFVGAFTPNGRCCGWIRWIGQDVTLIVWGDNTATPQVEGLKPGEQILLRVYRLNGELEWTNVTVNFAKGSDIYSEDSNMTLSSLTTVGYATLVQDDHVMTDEFTLMQNYPNPFNATTHITFKLPIENHINLAIYDLTGRKIMTVAEGFYCTGLHRIEWNAKDVASGIYLYRLTTTDGFSINRKLVIVK